MGQERCAESIRRLTDAIGVNADEAYAMILLTAVLTDLHPEDGQIVDMILKDRRTV